MQTIPIRNIYAFVAQCEKVDKLNGVKLTSYEVDSQLLVRQQNDMKLTCTIYERPNTILTVKYFDDEAFN